MSLESTDPVLPPPEGLGEAVLAAARAAGIGITVSSITESEVRNIWVSARALEIIGRPLRDVLERNAFDFIVPEERARLFEQRDSHVRSGRVRPYFETVLERSDGSHVPISASVSYVETSGQRLSVCFIQDISERKRAEDALRASDARFRRLMEDAPDGVVISRRGNVLWANDAAARLLGVRDGAALVGRSLDDHLDAEGARVMRERIAHSMATGERGLPHEYRARREDGSFVVAEITSHGIDYDGGPAVIAFARDVTERAALQGQLARADRLSALGTLAAGVAHEINNPLTYVSLGVDALERMVRAQISPEQSPRVHQLLTEIRHGATRVAAIVRELNAYSHFDEDARGPIDLREVFASVERLVAHHLLGRARLHINHRDTPLVLGNAGRLEQVFVNLVMNAVQALSENEAENRVDVFTKRGANGHAVVEVHDNGPGIPSELLGRVFDPFFTTKPPGVGTGLGLSICHRIVTQLGGEITIESDRGTVARVTLPAATEEPQSVPSQPRAQPDMSRRRLLVIDDEPALVLTLRCLLEQDHDVVTVTDGREALRRLVEDEPFHLVLCDLAMPGLDGPDLYDRVRERRPELAERFVFMTGGAFTEKITRFVERAARPCLQKPFPIAEIESLLRR